MTARFWDVPKKKTGQPPTRRTTGYLFELSCQRIRIFFSFTLLDSLEILNITYLPDGSVGLTVSLASVCPAPDKEHFSEAERDFFPLFQCAAPVAIFRRVCLRLYLYFCLSLHIFVYLCPMLSALKCCSPDQLFLANWPPVVELQVHYSQNCSVNQLLHACIFYYMVSFKCN